MWKLKIKKIKNPRDIQFSQTKVYEYENQSMN